MQIASSLVAILKPSHPHKDKKTDFALLKRNADYEGAAKRRQLGVVLLVDYASTSLQPKSGSDAKKQ
jgi:hypothetical protein